MSEDNQIVIPPSFIALFVPPGRIRPDRSREEIAERYEFCEDLATLLTERAGALMWELGITREDAIERVRRGLTQGDAGVSAVEGEWIARRLQELLSAEPGAGSKGG